MSPRWSVIKRGKKLLPWWTIIAQIRTTVDRHSRDKTISRRSFDDTAREDACHGATTPITIVNVQWNIPTLDLPRHSERMSFLERDMILKLPFPWQFYRCSTRRLSVYSAGKERCRETLKMSNPVTFKYFMKKNIQGNISSKLNRTCRRKLFLKTSFIM